jgi:endo-1,4-beta-xylanase
MALLPRAKNINALAFFLAAGASAPACSPGSSGDTAVDGSGAGGSSGTTGGAATSGRPNTQGGAPATGGAPISSGANTNGGTGANTGGNSVTGGSAALGGAGTNPAAGTAGATTGGVVAGGAAAGDAGKGGGTTAGQSGASGTSGGGKSGASGSASMGGGTATGGSGGGSACALGSVFAWETGEPVILPKSDATHDLVAVKDPTVVRYGDRWHLFASSVTKAGAYNMVYLNFADWTEAGTAPFYYMDQTPNFNTYTAAPQVFYFAPQRKWYLIFQSGPPMYSTNDDITAPSQWTRPAPFYASEPTIITQNDGWLDYWIICDDDSCHLFFSDDHGRWYKAKTSVASFPNGFSEPIVVMQDAEAGRLFEGSSVYKVSGSSKYLALIEAFDQSSNWKRYFRSWTSDSLEGPWQPLADSGTNPFVGKSNVTFTGTAWTNDISHGDMVRSGYDQTQVVDPCTFQFIYQGFDPIADGSPYNSLPWKLGLLTRKN